MASLRSGPKLKVVLVGDVSVGKTAIFNLFDKQEVDTKTQSTIGVTMRIKSMVTEQDHITVQVEVYDTAGEERYRSIMRQFYRDADVAIFVYDVTRHETFHHIGQYWKKDMFEAVGNHQIKMILIGNKTDESHARQVERDAAKDYARQNDMHYIEMSAYNCDHFAVLYEAIRTAVGQVMAMGGPYRYRMSLPQPSGGRLQEEPVINLNNQGEERGIQPGQQEGERQPGGEQQEQPPQRTGPCSGCIII